MHKNTLAALAFLALAALVAAPLGAAAPLDVSAPGETPSELDPLTSSSINWGKLIVRGTRALTGAGWGYIYDHIQPAGDGSDYCRGDPDCTAGDGGDGGDGGNGGAGGQGCNDDALIGITLGPEGCSNGEGGDGGDGGDGGNGGSSGGCENTYPCDDGSGGSGGDPGSGG